MKVGIVCPYDWSAPGGVQAHVRDLAVALIRLGHEVSVLAPCDEDIELPPYVVSVGGAVSVSYNGSKAKIAFGPVTTRRRGPSCPCAAARRSRRDPWPDRRRGSGRR